MVVFTCHHCGESLSKPKVEKHYAFVCRTTKSLTCVDCFKDFRGEEYVSHTKCLTEEERYAAKGTYTNKLVKKGEAKQEAWAEMVKSVLNKETNMNSSKRAIFDIISNASNIPKKKNKFLNFIKSSSGGRAYMRDIEEVWNLIEQYKNHLKDKGQTNGNQASNNAEQVETTNISPGKTKQSKNENNATSKRKIATEGSTENGQDENVPKTKKQKKTEEVTFQQNEEQLNESSKGFRFQDVILEVLSKKESTSLKKLQKKVINAYLKDTGETEVTPKIIKKFNKKLKKLSNVEVNDGVVTLKTNDFQF